MTLVIICHSPVKSDIDVKSCLKLGKYCHSVLNVLLQVSLLSCTQFLRLIVLEKVCGQHVQEVGGADVSVSSCNLNAPS